MTLSFVDADSIGVLGVCGGGGYAVNAAMTERRFKAVATVVAANYGRILRQGISPRMRPSRLWRPSPPSAPPRRAAPTPW